MALCRPAAAPAIVFVTTSLPGTSVYRLEMFATCVPSAATSTSWSLPSTTTCTVDVAPSTVSVTAQLDPAGIASNVCDEVPAGAPAAMTNDRATPSPQSTSIVTSPRRPAAGPLIVFCTTSAPGAGVYVSVIVA